jgi:hypothetical protein
MLKKRLLGLIPFLIALTAYAQGTTTTISRLQLVHPDLTYPGGSTLHTAIRTLFTKLGDNITTRYTETTSVANSAVTTITHNLGVPYSELRVLLYTGTGNSKVRVSNPTTAGWTIAGNGTNPNTQVDVTAPSSGGPHTFSVVILQENVALKDLTDVDLSTSAQDGQALVYSSTAGKFQPGASGDASFKMQSIATSTVTIKGGYIILQDGRELATNDGGGNASTNFGGDITANLTTVLGSSPANATIYYLYIDLDTLGNYTTTTDTGRRLYKVTSSNLVLLTTTPDSVLQTKYVPIGYVRSATTGTAWTGTGASFGTTAYRRHDSAAVTVSPVVYTQTATTVGSPGTSGQTASGHAVADSDFPAAVSDTVAFWNLSANGNDGSSATACTSGAAACNLTNNGTATFTTTSVQGTTNGAATLNGTSQYFSSTDAFMDPGDSDFAVGCWVKPNDWTPTGNYAVIAQDQNSTTDRGWSITIRLEGYVQFDGSVDGTNQAVVNSPVHNFVDGTWHHLAMRYDASTNAINGYLDGRLAATGLLGGNQRLVTTNLFTIGAKRNPAVSFFNGGIQDCFFAKQTLTDDDIRKIYAYRIDHSLNVPVDSQFWSGNWTRSDSSVVQQLPGDWLVSKTANSAYVDFSGLGSTAKVDLKMQDLGFSAQVVPAKTYDSGYLSSTPSTSISHRLPDVPTSLRILYETSTNNFDELQPSDWCSASSTTLTCDWTGLSVSSSNRVRIIAAVGNAAIAVGNASTAASGVVSTGTQAFSGQKSIQNGSLSLQIGADNTAGTLTDATQKDGRLVSPHYTNSEEPLMLLMGESTSSNNLLYLGGGSSLANAATSINFYTAANNTTTTGTQYGQLDGSGNWVFGKAQSGNANNVTIYADSFSNTGHRYDVTSGGVTSEVSPAGTVSFAQSETNFTDLSTTAQNVKNGTSSSGSVYVKLYTTGSKTCVFWYSATVEPSVAWHFSSPWGQTCTVSLSSSTYTISGLGDGRTYTYACNSGNAICTLKSDATVTGTTKIRLMTITQ